MMYIRLLVSQNLPKTMGLAIPNFLRRAVTSMWHPSKASLRLMTSCGQYSDNRENEKSHHHAVSKVDRLVVTSPGEKQFEISGMWLRDHCRCNECFDHSRYQRLYDTFATSDKPQIDHVLQNKNEIYISWKCGHSSVYDLDWLFNVTQSKPIHYPNRKLWNTNILNSANVDDISFEEYMNEPEGLAAFLKTLYTYGLAYIKDVPVTKEALLAVSRRISYLRECEYGKEDILVSPKNKYFDDIAYTNLPLGFHTDSAFSVEPLGYILLHLFEHDGEGGLGCYADGYYIAESLRKENPEAFRILSEVLVTQELLDKGVHYKGSYPVFTVRDNDVKIIRYQPTDRLLTQHLSFEETELFYEAMNLFYKVLHRPENNYWVKYERGRVLMFDNFRLLHGRSQFTGNRVLRNTILPRDEVDCKIRTLTGFSN